MPPALHPGFVLADVSLPLVPCAQCVVPYLSLYTSADVAAKACGAFLDACYEDTQDSGPVQDEEEGEDLCNCEFSLAYGEGWAEASCGGAGLTPCQCPRRATSAGPVC